MRFLVFTITICAMTISPVTESLSYLDKNNVELFVEIETDNDSNETENQEEETKPKKVKLHLPIFKSLLCLDSVSPIAERHKMNFKNFTNDIPIPPPDQG